MTDTNHDYYELLGLGRDATDADIKKAYRRLAIQYHPDRNQGSVEAEEKFKQISEAYQVLSDPQQRNLYDRFGKEGLRGAGFSAGFSSVDDIFSSFGSIFEDFFGFQFGGSGRSRSGRRGVARGADLRYELEIRLEEAIQGAEKEIVITSLVACKTCSGSGSEPGSSKKSCLQCQGTGQYVQSQGFFAISTPCPICRGEGQIIEKPCQDCKGNGLVEKRRKIEVKIPAGVDDGTRMRLSGEGEHPKGGGQPGDLYVFLHVLPSDRFVREGLHLHTETEIDFVQAVLGTTVDIELIEGIRSIEIPKGTQPGDTVVLRGDGVPRLRGIGKGDLIVHVRVKIPKRLGSKQEELLRQYAEVSKLGVHEKKKGLFSRHS